MPLLKSYLPLIEDVSKGAERGSLKWAAGGEKERDKGLIKETESMKEGDL